MLVGGMESLGMMKKILSDHDSAVAGVKRYYSTKVRDMEERKQ